MKFGTNVKNDIVYKIMKSIFEKKNKFHFWITLQNTLIGCALVTMATKSETLLHYFVRIVLMYLPPQKNGANQLFRFWVTFAPVFSQSGACLVTMATRAKQPLFFTTRHHGLQYGIQHTSTDI